jgi:hypothetical protein
VMGLVVAGTRHVELLGIGLDGHLNGRCGLPATGGLGRDYWRGVVVVLAGNGHLAGLLGPGHAGVGAPGW